MKSKKVLLSMLALMALTSCEPLFCDCYKDKNNTAWAKKDKI